jgi:thiamine biosynthesis lipoprotein
MKSVLPVCLVLAVNVLSCNSHKGPQRASFGGKAFGIDYRVDLVDDRKLDPGGLQRIKEQTENELARLAHILSMYDDDSEISKLNALKVVGRPLSVSMDLFALLEIAERLQHETKGAFDITVGPLVRLWGFAPRQGVPATVPPSDAEIQKLLKRTRGRGFELAKEQQVVKHVPDLELDVKAVTKGFVIDKVIDRLQMSGYRRLRVQLGGQVGVRGLKEDGTSWTLPVEADPRTEIVLHDGGVGAAANYHTYVVKDGKRYIDIIDPRTGRPASHDIVFVLATAPTAARADGLAAAMMVLGVEEGMKMIEALPEVEALVVVRGPSDQLTKHLSSGMKINSVP